MTRVALASADEPLPRRRRKNRACVDLIGAYLYQQGIGFRFTIPDLEQLIQGSTGIRRTEVDRRLRSLRSIGWVIDSNLSDPSLGRGEYEVKRIGDHCWRREYVWPSSRSTCPGPLRRSIIERDKLCQICGITPGQPFPDEPWRLAFLTVGRLMPGVKGGPYSLSNCRAECQKCNLDARDQYNDDDELPPAA